jgi:hypothetical protein
MENRKLNTETQSTQRGHREVIQASVLPPCPLCLCGECLFQYIQLNLVLVSALALCLLCATSLFAQSTTDAPQAPATGVIRLRVRPKFEGKEKGLSRKRFFLIKGSLEENQSLIEKLVQTPLLQRECYYRSIGASEALIRWLKENDCESVYCREIERQDTEGSQAVPEFKTALAQGAKELGNTELARKWITVNLREEIRSGFYKRQQEALSKLIKQAEGASGAKVTSVMTDRNGTAYFTDLAPGTYLISNLIPTETGNNSILWNCEIKVKAGEPGAERPFLISNQKGGNVKCVGIEKPLPPCNEANK